MLAKSVTNGAGAGWIICSVVGTIFGGTNSVVTRFVRFLVNPVSTVGTRGLVSFAIIETALAIRRTIGAFSGRFRPQIALLALTRLGDAISAKRTLNQTVAAILGTDHTAGITVNTAFNSLGAFITGFTL